MSMLKKPMHPGKFLKEAYLIPSGFNAKELATKMNVSASSVSRLISCKSELSYSMAIRLSKVFKRTAESWMNVQVAYGLEKAKEELKLEVKTSL